MEADKVKALGGDSSDYLSSLNHLTSLAMLSSSSLAGEWGKEEAADTISGGSPSAAGWHLIRERQGCVSASRLGQSACGEGFLGPVKKGGSFSKLRYD